MESRDRKTFRFRLESLTNSVREDIMMGKYKPGDFLPSEKSLAKQYGLSNKTVRKGLGELDNEGLIEKIPRVGNRVINISAGSTITLQFGYYSRFPTLSSLDKLLAKFREKHPEIHVYAFSIPDDKDYCGRVKELMDKDELDVAAINNSGLSEFSEQGDLESFQTLAVNPDIYPFLTEATSFKGHLKAHPVVFTPTILCYNKDHFREKGLPEPDSSWRWEDILKYADLLSVPQERLGFYAHYLSENRWPVFLLQNGVVFKHDHDGRLRLSGTPLGERLIESAEAYKELILAGHKTPLILSESDEEEGDLFFSGKASMIMTTYLSLNHNVLKKNIRFNYDISPLPYLYDARTLLGVIGLAVNARSKMKESARLFIDFLVSPEAEMIIRQSTLSIPSLKTAAEWSGQDAVNRPSRFHLFREIAPSYRLITELGLSPSERKVFLNEAKLYWSGLSDEETFIRHLENSLSRSN